MKEITVNTQKEFDSLPKVFKEYTRIYLQDTKERIIVQFSRENSSVEAWGNSSVEAWGNSSVVARENSSVVARENSSVEAWGNSSVEAWGNSSVEAWGNSSVEAWGNSCTWMQSSDCIVTLFMYAVCFAISVGKIIKKSKTATVIKPKLPKGVNGWITSQAIKPTKKVIVYKRVSKDFKTQEGTSNEFLYKIGTNVEVKHWTPKDDECGEGKLHACSRPYFCDEFRSEVTDVYIAIEVDKKDLYAWPNPSYPHKIAFRKGKVLYQCDRFGKKI